MSLVAEFLCVIELPGSMGDIAVLHGGDIAVSQHVTRPANFAFSGRLRRLTVRGSCPVVECAKTLGQLSPTQRTKQTSHYAC
jgi:hypothetical protein